MSRDMSMVVTFTVPDAYTEGELREHVEAHLRKNYFPGVNLKAVHKPVVDQR